MSFFSCLKTYECGVGFRERTVWSITMGSSERIIPKKSSSKLDEEGLEIAVCRHGFPSGNIELRGNARGTPSALSSSESYV